MQLQLIGAGYAVVLSFAAVVIYQRYAWAAANPEIVLASSGMYAGGDGILAFFITICLMVPTLFLVRVVSQFERPATIYAKVLAAIGLTTPLCLALFRLGSPPVPELLLAASFFRLVWSPFTLVLMIASRFMAKYPQTRRLTNYALLAEGATIAAAIVMIVLAMNSPKP
ncbi:MAG: hypothetical protein EXQ56_05870 [Acidobacteria bacterium]|nr:hypothetical protein [Acidobacteriota bacterium]